MDILDAIGGLELLYQKPTVYVKYRADVEEEEHMPLTDELITAMEGWTADLAEQHRSADTVASYQYALTLFRRWLATQPGHHTLDSLSVTVFSHYVNHLRARKLAPSTIYAYIGVLTRWAQDLVNQGELAGIPNRRGRLLTPAGLRELLERMLERRAAPVAPRVPDLRRLPAYYPAALAAFLAERAGAPPPAGQPLLRRRYLNLLRNRALVATLFSTGGRINEVLDLTVAAVQSGGRIRNAVAVTGKGRKRRSLRLDPDAQAAIAAYLAARQPHFPTAAALFISHGPNGAGQRLSDVTAWKVVKEAAESLADERMREGADDAELRALRAVSPHSLRHYLAQAMLDEGADYKDITAILGHSSAVVTEQFYARLGDERALEIADTFAPRASPSFRAVPHDSADDSG